jgi:hypothetical protein
LLDLVPQVLLHTNIEAEDKNEQEEDHKTMIGQTIAQEVGIKVYKELTNNNVKDVTDALMMTVNEPKRGMSDAKLQIAEEIMEKERRYANWLPKNSGTLMAIIGMIAAGAATAAYFYLKSRK